MSKAIEFRGLTVDGDFVYGFYVQDAFDGTSRNVAHGIQSAGCYPVEIDPETLGQFTGLHDCKGVKIFDGDIVQSYHFTDENRKDQFISHIVKWSDKFNGWFMLNKQDLSGNDGSIQMWVYMKSSKYTANVIGNIHQNSELLK